MGVEGKAEVIDLAATSMLAAISVHVRIRKHVAAGEIEGQEEVNGRRYRYNNSNYQLLTHNKRKLKRN